MIILVSFDSNERSLIEKASHELQIADRITHYDGIDDLFEKRRESVEGGLLREYPRVIIMNIDHENCLADMAKAKAADNWKTIPIIGYGFLKSESDVTEFYGAGGASCIRKPHSYAEMVATTRGAIGYWLSMSTLPCDYLREA